MIFKGKAIHRWITVAGTISALLLGFFLVNPSYAQSVNQTEPNPQIPADNLQGALPLVDVDENRVVFKAFQEDTLHYMPLSSCVELEEDCDAQATGYLKPEHPPITGTAAFLTEENRGLVDNPLQWPHSSTTKLIATWPSGEISECSGMLIEAKHMLTAAHCVYSHNPAHCQEGQAACWVEDLEIMPGYHQGKAALGKTGFSTLLTWTAWTDHQDFAYDLAAVELGAPLGAYIGWLGFGFNVDNAFFLNQSFTSTTYPCESPFDGQQMSTWTGNLSAADPHTLSHPAMSVYGEDGGALHNDHAVIYGAISHVTGDAQTQFTRLTYEKFDAIRFFISEGRPKGIGDLSIFNTNALPTLAFPGQKISSLNFYVQNHAEEDLASQVYTADIIFSSGHSAGDDYQILGSFEFEHAFPANHGLRVTLPPEISASIPDTIESPGPLGGTYYLGVILSAAQPDYNPENNRTTGHQMQPIWVFDSDNSYYFFPVFHQ